jgi:two-component system CheB/CheR fusion protein
VILLAFDDVSELRRREVELAKADLALREANRRKDEFLAMLSHELRNPIAPIRNSLELLLCAEPGSERANKAVAIIDRQVSHLTRLIDDLLDVTRISTGKILIHREVFDLSQIVRSTLEDMQRSFDDRGIRLDSELVTGALFVDGDRPRIAQVLSNVLTNAEKFTDRGGHVVVSLTLEGDRIALRVRDDGAGIPQELLSRLGQPFAQGPQTMARSRGGLGLGLAMVKGLVELHGGSFKIESEGLGLGTEVTVLFPAVAMPTNVASAMAAERPLPVRRVLVIEDNSDAADSLRDLLVLHGQQVAVAPDGPRALALAARFHPDVVLCDIGLPEMDGYAVARAFRADDSLREAYLVALTGYALPQDVKRSAAAGFDEHVAKPLQRRQIERLLKLIQRATMPAPARAASPS